MTVTGTVTKVIRRKTAHGSVYITADVDGKRLRWLHGWETVPARGDKVEISGMPIIGRKGANIGAVTVRIIPT